MSRRRTEVSDSMTAALTERAVKKREVRMVNFILAVWRIWVVLDGSSGNGSSGY